MSRRRPRRAGFTLVEVMMVILIMAILAGAVIPQFEGATTDAKDATLRYNLTVFRHQIEYFRAQHNGDPPGFNDVPVIFHLWLPSKPDGQVTYNNDPSFRCGPYFGITSLPMNPFNNGLNIAISSDPANETPDEGLMLDDAYVGYFYDIETGRLSANAEGSTREGIPRIKL